MQYGPPPNSTNYQGFQPPFDQQPGSFQQQPPNFAPQQQPSFSQAPPGFGSPDMIPQFPNNQQFGAPQQFNQQGPGFSPPFQSEAPQSFNPASPPPFQKTQFQPPRNHTPPQLDAARRPANVPSAPGLPQRSSVGAPPVNAFQMQQMHQRQILTTNNPPNGQQFAQSSTEKSTQPANVPFNASSLDDLVSDAAKEADKAETAVAERKEEKKSSKKNKGKNTKLIYSDNDVSPEKKMAQLSRYSFVLSTA